MAKSKMMKIAAAVMAVLSIIFAFATESVVIKVKAFGETAKEKGKLFDLVKDSVGADFLKTAKAFLIIGLIAGIIGVLALVASALTSKNLSLVATGAIAVFVLCLLIAVWFVLAPEYKKLASGTKFGFTFIGWLAVILGIGAAGCAFLSGKEAK